MLGITIYRAHLGSDLTRRSPARSTSTPQLGFSILVNLDMTRGRRRFTAAHELAHALLHSGSEAIVVPHRHRGDQREAYADAFAGEFLMPEEGIRRTLEPRRRPQNRGRPDPSSTCSACSTSPTSPP